MPNTTHRRPPQQQAAQRRRTPANSKPAPKKSATASTVFCVIRRTLLVLFTILIIAIVALVLVCLITFRGPSKTASEKLTMAMVESSGMKWFPGLFLGQEQVDLMCNNYGAVYEELPEGESNTEDVVIADSEAIATSDEWKNYPDGIRIETVQGNTYTAHVMLIADPSQIYLATSTTKFSKDVPGKRINQAIESEGAIAAINAGGFFDNGTSQVAVGAVPEGLLISGGKVLWTQNETYKPEGFVGFTQDNVLIVSDSMTASKAKELGIRDGCAFGPVLIKDGAINESAYNAPSGYNPRTAIGQRRDGVVIFICIDGRQAGSLGGSYADIINLMVKYGAHNACNLDGGSSSVMYYRDTYNRYGGDGRAIMINNYSLLQEQPRKMPSFFMVRPSDSKEG